MLKSLQNTTKIAKKFNQQSATLLNAAKKQKRTRFDYTLSCSFEVVKSNDSSFTEKVKASSKLGETSTTETYFDKVPAVLQANKVSLTNPSPLFTSTPEYTLGRRDSWLKLVNGKTWELKYPFKNEQNANKTHLDLEKTTQRTPMYMLAVGEKSIRRELNLQQDATAEHNNTLEQDLRERGILPFANIKLVQETFAYNDAKNITVDVISTDFGYKYSIVKIRIPNCRQLDIDTNLPAFETAIDELGFAEQRAAKKPARDAAKEYIARNLKDYYRFLVDNGIVQDS